MKKYNICTHTNTHKHPTHSHPSAHPSPWSIDHPSIHTMACQRRSCLPIIPWLVTAVQKRISNAHVLQRRDAMCIKERLQTKMENNKLTAWDKSEKHNSAYYIGIRPLPWITVHCWCRWYAVYFWAHTKGTSASTDDMDNTSGIALWCRHIRGPHSTQISDTDTGGQDTGYMIQISNTYTMWQFYTYMQRRQKTLSYCIFLMKSTSLFLNWDGKHIWVQCILSILSTFPQ